MAFYKVTPPLQKAVIARLLLFVYPFLDTHIMQRDMVPYVQQ